jgi:predicted Rossmann fold flavoprotein
MQKFDCIVIGAGAAGLMASISSASDKKSVLLVEKMPQFGLKLKATGGGRCNLTNTLSNDDFMARFGSNGKFMRDALYNFDRFNLVEFFESIGVKCACKDGFRIFPDGHKSTTILEAFEKELNRLNVELLLGTSVARFNYDGSTIKSILTDKDEEIFADNFILASGGLGYPTLGAQGDGYNFAKDLGHKVTTLSPAMMPLHTKENWTVNCTANTLAKVEVKIDLPKYKKYKANGDLIFTKNGIRGPVVLDFAREITPLLEKYNNEVPILINLVKGQNQEELRSELKTKQKSQSFETVLELLNTILPTNLNLEILKMLNIDPKVSFGKIPGQQKDNLLKYIVSLPMTVIGHDGFKMAMITRGGVSLKEINPKTMKSKIIENLYFCGEVMDIDGPCGGFNLQWSFSSGYLAGKTLR